MSAYSRASNMAAYQNTAAHGGVAAADSHKLILMLMDGALERIAGARGCMERKETGEKARLLNRSVSIIDELRNSLDMQGGGQISANLAELYDYMCRCILKANADNTVRQLDEVSNLLHEIRGAWAMIPADVRNAARSAK